MERAPDGQQPGANLSGADEVLGALQSVGSALLESVSSISKTCNWSFSVVSDYLPPPVADQNISYALMGSSVIS